MGYVSLLTIGLLCALQVVHGAVEADPAHLRKHLIETFGRTRNHFVSQSEKNNSLNVITSTFKTFGLTTDLHVFDTNATGVLGVNSVGILKGRRFGTKDDKIVILGAHYDTCRNTPGVIDNGSGVAAMLEATRLLANQRAGCTRENTIIFMGFDFEESEKNITMAACNTGLCGSRMILEEWLLPFFATNYPNGSPTIQTTIVLDCVFNYNNTVRSQTIPPQMEVVLPKEWDRLVKNEWRGNFIAAIGRNDEKEIIKQFLRHLAPDFRVDDIVIPITGPPNEFERLAFRDFMRSDHTNFWLRNYPAVFLSDTANFRGTMAECYHNPCDDISYVTTENLDFLAKLTTTIVSYFNEVAVSSQECIPRSSAEAMRPGLVLFTAAATVLLRAL